MSVKGNIQPTQQSASISPSLYEGETKVAASRKIAIMVGAFFLLSNATFLLGAFGLVESILGSPDYLTLVSANRSQVVLGVLLEITNAVAYLGIAVLMFPLLKPRFESLALGYVGFRILEFVMQTLSDLSPLALVSMSEAFVDAGAPAGSSFQTVGTLLLANRYWAFQMVSILLGLGALLFYSMLYRSKLIPRFISAWGLLGALTVLTSTLLTMFAISISPAIELVIGLPMLLNELFLGVWLIVKGFNPAAVAALSEKQA
jgi:hypothetical protein